jgi:hypothetical protein
MASNIINLQSENKILREFSGDASKYLTESLSIKESGARGSTSGINITPSQMEKYKQEQSRGGGGGGYASLGGSGIQGATIATSTLRPGNIESAFRSPSGIA